MESGGRSDRAASRAVRSSRVSGLIAVVGLALAAGGCGAGAPGVRPAEANVAGTCTAEHLDRCERAIASAVAEGTVRGKASLRERVAAYARARAERDARDPWAEVWSALSSGAPAECALVAEGSAIDAARASAASLAGRARVIAIGALAPPRDVGDDELLLAMGAASGWPLVVRVREGAAPGRLDVRELFPGDPLAPFVAALPAVVRDDGALADLAGDTAIALSIERAFDHAAAFRYVDAAREADRLATLARRADRPLLRARHALALLGAAGIALDAPEASSSPPTAGAGETPYAALLAVRTAKDERAAWTSRRDGILRGIPPDRRAAMTALFERSPCGAPIAPPPMEGPRDLAFLSRLAGTRARDAGDEARGLLVLDAWLARSAAAVRAVDEAKTAWAHLPALLADPSALSLLAPTGAAERVRELALAHLAALGDLQRAEPGRYRALATLPLAFAPGLAGDDRLGDALVKLLRATVHDQLARATDPAGVFEGVLAGVFAGMSYPPSLRAAHFAALDDAVTSRLQGDLAERTGWGVAGLHAADAAFRAVTGDVPRVARSASQTARALDTTGLPVPALAALSASAARYAALAASNRGGDAWRAAPRASPERGAARDSLRRAIAGLGAPGEAPANVLDDVTDLADGLIAAIVHDRARPSPAPAKTTAKEEPACGAKPRTPDPVARRALAKLGDVRRRILLHPRFKEGDGLWVRRARLVVAVLSDGLDIATSAGSRPTFTLATRDVERTALDALREWDDRSGAAAVASAYALAREYAVASSADAFLRANSMRIRSTAAGVAGWLRSDPAERAAPAASKGAGVAILDALASMAAPAAREADVTRDLLAYARAFHERGEPDRADLCLLGTLLLSALAHEPPAPEVLDAAARQKSRVEWALRLTADAERVRRGAPPDPASYAAGARDAAASACATADVDSTTAVMTAIRDFAAGRRSDARRALDDVLARAETHGLAVPAITYRYDEKTPTKVLALSFGVSLGAPLLAGAGSFQLGLGVRSGGAPEGSLATTVEPSDASPTARSATDALRYYVHVAALAAAWHFLDGDRERAAHAAHRAVSAATFGVRLGPRRATAPEPSAGATAAADARGLLAIDAQLAADAGLPFLAGDLFTLVRGSLARDADDAAVAAIVDPLPIGLLGIGDASPIARAGAKALRSLRAVAEPLACTDKKIEPTAYAEPTCDAYPLALSLRISDSLKKLPRIARGAACDPGLRALDAFLAAADRGTYDPDAFTRAVETLRAGGRGHEAAVLLTRHRREGHCSPAIHAAARTLGVAPSLAPPLRADLLSVAVNCGVGVADARFADDVIALDGATLALANPSRNLRLVLFVADVAAQRSRWDLLSRLAAQPDFVDRWTADELLPAAVALVVDHTALVLQGGGPPHRHAATFARLCAPAPQSRALEPLCDALRSLRAPATTAATRERIAREALKAIVASARPAPAKGAP